MRYLFQDRLDFASAADFGAVLTIEEVEIPIGTYAAGFKQRDIWFRFDWPGDDVYPTDPIQLRAYKTRSGDAGITDEALATPGAIAQNLAIVHTGALKVTLTDNDGSPGWGDDLRVQINVRDASALVAGHRSKWGYTSRISELIATNAKAVLSKYTGSNLDLEDVRAIYPHVAGDSWVHSDLPALYVSVGEPTPIIGNASEHAVHAPLRVRCHTMILDELEETHRVNIALRDRVAGIIFDEQRTLLGAVKDVMLASIGEPTPMDTDDGWGYMTSMISGLCVIERLRDDRSYPREV
jgi:hypothetical protein